MSPPQPDPRKRLTKVQLDERMVVRRSPEIEHERAIAIYDLIEENRFAPIGHDGGPYHLTLGMFEGRLVFDISEDGGDHVHQLMLSLSPFRKIIRDYFMICESYYSAIKKSSLAQIEAIDMGRRGLHNEGAELLMTRLKDKIELDLDTARRLFTLVCVLQIGA